MSSLSEIVDECESSPCQNGGTCTDFELRYQCACTEEYSGSSCEFGIHIFNISY